mgnify:CR=1 FL=1
MPSYNVPHPDATALRDWALYGPQDPGITQLVERLANERHWRLAEIEVLIRDALTAALGSAAKYGPDTKYWLGDELTQLGAELPLTHDNLSELDDPPEHEGPGRTFKRRRSRHR